MPSERRDLGTTSAAFWERYNAIAASHDAQVRTRPHGPRLPYLSGLDGIRAIAVLAVVLYHGGIAWMPGGFLGVEVFFVLSGYLITSLLLAEWGQRERIDLKSFWIRRARRLLPALFLLLGVVLTFALVALPREVASLRADALAAFAYVTNWYHIFAEKSYFETIGRPSLLQHLWSLAVEEQFYILWPLIFTVAMARWSRRRVLAGILTGALASTVLMALLYEPAVDPSRIYYGTDTRAAELLFGAALAFVWEPARLRQQGSEATGRLLGWFQAHARAPLALDLAGAVGLAGIIVAFLTIGEFDRFLYQGGFALVGIATVLLTAAVAHPRARWLPWFLGLPPLRWLGLRSYSLYLWHWPVNTVTRPHLDVPIDGLPLLALRVATSVVLAEISYRCIETPFRTGAVGRLWRSLRTPAGAPRRRVQGWAAAGGTLMTFTVVIGVMVAQAKPPPPPSYLPVERVHVRAEDPTPTATPTPLPIATPEAGGSYVWIDPIDQYLPPPPEADPEPAVAAPLDHNLPAPTTPAPEPTPEPTPEAEVVLRVSAVGDSVMVGASNQLIQDIGNLSIDAEVGMQASQAISILRWQRDNGLLGDIVVVHIGNNGPLSADQFDELMQVLTDVQRVVIVNLKVPRAWEGPNNQILADGVARYPNATLVNWHAASSARPDLFWDDGIHVRADGARLYSGLITTEIMALEQSLQAARNQP